MRPDLYTRLYLWLSSQRRLVLIATLVVTAASIVISSRMDLEEDILEMLPHHDQRVDEYRYALKKFRQIDRVYLDIGLNTDDTEKLGRAADEMFALLSTNASFVRFMYRIELGGQGKIVDFFTGALPNLFTEADAPKLETKLAPAAIREHLTSMRRKLAGPEGMVVKDLVAADPLGASELVYAKILPLQTGFGGAQIVDGRITSRDGRHVLMMAEPKFGSSNSKASKSLVAEMLAAAGQVEKDFPGVHVAITGGHRMSVDNARLITIDSVRCITLGMVAMLVLCLTAYRRRWLAVVTFLPSFVGSLLAGVVLALGWPHLSAIATGFATIAIGITVDYAIYVIYHLDNAAGLDRAGIGRHVGRLVLPITVGALTTIAAFLVMATSPMHGYQQLGVFGAAGVLFSAMFSLIILPLLVPVPKQTGQPPLWLTRVMEKFHGAQLRRRGPVLLVLLVLTVATAFGVKRVRFDGELIRLNGITQATRDDDAIINKTWGEVLSTSLVIARGTNVEAALRQNDFVYEKLKPAAGVSSIYSLAAVCPSQATQEANIRRWREFWTPARRESLRENLNQIGGGLGFRADAFARFWERLEGEPRILTLDLFRGTPLEQALTERVALGEGDAAISTMFKLNDRSQVGQIREMLAGAIVLDSQDFAKHIAALAKGSLGHFALWTGIAVTAVVHISLGSIELVLATLLPLAFGLLWTFGLMGWFGLPIDMMNSVFVIFIIGVGEDYSVFFVTSKLDEWRGLPKRLAATSASVLISALTTIFGFAVLIFAKHPVLFSLGTTVLLGMVSTFVATLILTPLCMDLLLFRRQPTGAPRWWHPLGTLWVAVHLGSSQIFLYYILRPLLKLFSPRAAAGQLRRATRWMARGVVKAMPFGKLEFKDIAPETFSPPCIVISNHQSAVDVMLVVSLPGDVRQTAKKRVFDEPFLGIGCKILGHVMVEPDRPAVTLQRCRERLAAGASVHFYPESTRSRDGFVQRFYRGAFELAVELKQDILPVLLCDTCTAVPRDGYWFEPYHAVVRALPRVTPQNFDYSQGPLALMRHCEKIVRDGLQAELDRLNTPKILRRKVERLYRYQGKFIELFAHFKLKNDRMFAPLDRVVPREGLILDLGCGYGLATQWLAQCTDRRSFHAVDFDENKIRAARQTALENERIKFEVRDILEWEFPACDTALLLDVLHYWTPDKQALILKKIRRALRPNGRLVLRDAARDEGAGHRRVVFWEKIATRTGHNRTREGLHFQSLDELTALLQRAGFTRWEIIREAAQDSNVLLFATFAPPQCAAAQTP